jgi:hypothetical protein
VDVVVMKEKVVAIMMEKVHAVEIHPAELADL